jgi:hypothetical protein
VATVGWNVGGSLRVNAPPSVGNIQSTLNQILSDNSNAYDALMGGGTAVTAIHFIRTKTNNVAAVEGRTIHAKAVSLPNTLKRCCKPYGINNSWYIISSVSWVRRPPGSVW